MEALVEHRGKQFLVKENLELKVPYLGGIDMEMRKRMGNMKEKSKMGNQMDMEL